ncbi:uncharacterized protein DUF3846 [Streptomyces sp. KhCrAH-43]|uniref:DUF3846 domain-containing protein n=1 Tax=unclassified Streptomyces TaxID=2593676 RepID=UPI00037EF7E7|nr:MULTISPECIES: DUF3846 domain-containing protein [unclassified Streptomyces]MYS39657.1 DUF3846 domain-containing protein [Streptomyces sp. SID4920]MYX64337.1 DUF3846 domain-containing protein [Streptomyces sp. SID8373]RAJ47782.1 uncharacterized protein DUF3846 [Streptomyces sp. KhCrAH-43]
MNDSTTETRHALLVRPDGFFQVLDWPGESSLQTLYRAIDCRAVDVADITPTLSMWVDDEGAINGCRVNVPATHLFQAHGTPRQAYFGNAVFTGGTDSRGDTLGLTQDQLLTLVVAVLDGLPNVIYIPAQR